MEQPHVGILAYGSLIDDLGPDLTPLKVGPPVTTTTPFPVEFARSSASRDGAPTLVPFDDGRPVAAVIQEVKATIPDATNFLYWRERHLPQGSPDRRPYRRPKPVTKNSIVIKQRASVSGFSIVLYTAIGANISPLTPVRLASLAIASAKQGAGGKNPPEDGISYLINAKKHGIVTNLSGTYEQEILRQTSTKTLEGAWQSCRK